MILIGGTELDKSALPNPEIMDYQIENGKRLGIKLSTTAKNADCFKIYLNERLRTEVTITQEISEKVVYFRDDDNLLDILTNGEKHEEDIFSEEVADSIPDFRTVSEKTDEKGNNEIFSDNLFNIVDEEVETKEVIAEKVIAEEVIAEEVIAEEVIAEEVQLEKKGSEIVTEEKERCDKLHSELNNTLNSELNLGQGFENKGLQIPEIADLEEVDTAFTEDFLKIPNLGEDIDNLRVMLENKEQVIQQKDGMLKELQLRIDEIYKLQEIQMSEIKEAYEIKIKEVNSTIAELETRSVNSQFDQETLNFTKYSSYSKKPKAALREGFTEEETEKMGKLHSKYFIFATASGESYYSMMKRVKKYIDKSPNVLVLDFSNDYYLNTVYRVNSQLSSMDLVKDENEITDVIKPLNSTRIAFTTLYNDIALLGLDWAKTLRKIDDFASGKPVIMIFNNINSFSVRYTVSKLATIGSLYVFTKCSPLVLSSVYGDIKFIPAERVTIVAIEFIDVVKALLDSISKSYKVIAFGVDIDWGKLGLKEK